MPGQILAKEATETSSSLRWFLAKYLSTCFQLLWNCLWGLGLLLLVARRATSLSNPLAIRPSVQVFTLDWKGNKGTKLDSGNWPEKSRSGTPREVWVESRNLREKFLQSQEQEEHQKDQQASELDPFANNYLKMNSPSSSPYLPQIHLGRGQRIIQIEKKNG